MNGVMNLNLLPSEAKFQMTKVRLQKKIRWTMMGLVGLWILSMIIAYGWGFVVESRLKVAESKREKTLADYNSMTDKVMVNQSLKYQAKLVGKALAARFEYGKAFETVNELFPDGIQLNDFEMDPSGFFKVTGSTSGKTNVDKLENLVATVNSGKDDRFKAIRLTSIQLKNGVWKFVMEVDLK